MKSLTFLTLVALPILTLGSITASAHVVVKPAISTPSSYEIFNISVPNEKEQVMTKLRLIVPDGLGNPRPTQKSGWTVNTIKNDKGDIKEIEWTGGQLAADLRDDFSFSAKTPATETVLPWKAYQTFADGNQSAWTEQPKGSDAQNPNPSKPYSVTKIEIKKDPNPVKTDTNLTNTPLFPFAIASLVISTVALVKSFVPKK